MNRAVSLSPGFVPALPALTPAELLKAPCAGVFPFDQPGFVAYYFGRSAVFHALRSLSRGDRNQVLVPAYHHGVEVEAILQAGNEIDFFRVNGRMEVDLKDLERRIRRRTGAIYLIYYLGFPQPVRQIQALCRERGLLLVEDCALSLFSAFEDRPMGSFGDAAIFSFHKTLPVPNGGGLLLASGSSAGLPKRRPPPWISTASHTAGAILRGLKQKRPQRWGPIERTAKGAMSRLLSLGRVKRTSVGDAQFDLMKANWGASSLSARLFTRQDVPELIRRRRENYNYLAGVLRGKADLLFQDLPKGVCPLFLPVLVDRKESVLDGLSKRGVEGVNFWSVRHPRLGEGLFPEVDDLRSHVLELPIHQGLSRSNLERVAEAFLEVI